MRLTTHPQPNVTIEGGAGNPARAGRAGGAYEHGAQEEQARQELRASALRAKLKAQTDPRQPADESAGLDEPKAGLLGHGRIRTWTSARAGNHRSSLLLGAAMAFLFGTGFVAVDSLLGSAPPAGAQRRGLEAQPAARNRQGRCRTAGRGPEGAAGAAPATGAEPIRAGSRDRRSEPGPTGPDPALEPTAVGNGGHGSDRPHADHAVAAGRCRRLTGRGHRVRDSARRRHARS